MSNSTAVQRILQLCLEIFELNLEIRKEWGKPVNQSNLARKVYPKAKYKDWIKKQKELNKLKAAGDRWRLTQCSELGKACYFGHYTVFKKTVNDISNKVLRKPINFNIWFECESELSLLHLILFGRRDLILYPRHSSNKDHIDWQLEHFRIVNYLLNNGIDINIQNKWGYAVLHESLLNIPDFEYAKLLLTNGANPNQYTILGTFPMIGCMVQNHIESVKLLCEYNADPRLLDYGSGITPISFSIHHIEMESIVYNALTKIRNKCKLYTNSEMKQEQELEYENPSYCCVCGITSKIKSLYQCSKCRGPKRYCSHKCQKRDWKTHKLFCHKNRRKVTNIQEKEIVFKVVNAVSNPKLFSFTNAKANAAETFAEYNLKSRAMEMPKYQKRQQKKRNKLLNNTVIYAPTNPIKRYYKFPVKIQIPLYKMWSKASQQMMCYNKARSYYVFIPYIGQKKKYNKLEKLIETKSDVIEKAYFYAYIDNKDMLHVLISKLLAMQPW
eukprot:262075_1